MDFQYREIITDERMDDGSNKALASNFATAYETVKKQQSNERL
jgi:hypothetical protein